MQVQILSLEIVPELNSLANVICKVNFSLIEDLGILDPEGMPEKLRFGGSCFLTPPSGAGFVSYNSLTEAQVVTWIKSTKEFIDVENQLINELRLFSLQGLQVKDLPWA
jgi:hypothetical protein